MSHIDTIVVGGTGTVGSYLLNHLPSSTMAVCSTNLESIRGHHCDHLVIAAPSGNRRWVKQHPDLDDASVDHIMSVTNMVHARMVTMLSTIDVLQYPHTVYGANRLRLERFLQQRFACTRIIRLGGFIYTGMKKNVLFDIKHGCYLDDINLDSVCQWTPFAELFDLLDVPNIGMINAVSEPISVREIVTRFRPDLLSQVGKNPVECQTYNVTPYLFARDLVFRAISEYMS